MQIITQMLNEWAREGRLGYHPRCRGPGLTHLTFADNMIIFTDCSEESYRTILDTFNEFYGLSGLRLSPEKSKFFVTGIPQAQANMLATVSGFSIGTLPIRYLGVPLITMRLRVHDCQALVDKIIAKVRCWTSKSLSYAGWLQLIASVIQSMTQFWCAHFILPKQVLKCIE